jgi:hypothetical protein
MTDDLEDALRDLGTQIVVPEPPDVTAAVRARIAVKPRFIARPVLTGALALLVAFAVALAVSPAVRAGVTELLRFAGIEFRSEPPPSTPQSPPPDERNKVALDEARRILPIHLPAALGEPEEIRVVENRFVSLLYRGSTVRLDEFNGQIGPVVAKFGDSLGVEKVTVNGTDGLWVPGPHEVVYIDRNGEWRTESARLSGKTLIWQVGEVTLRLEGDFTKEQALAIAR